MPQFRLTQKFATDCKIKQLVAPMVTQNPLDDWLIDRMVVDRKKIAAIVHAKTLFSFFIPYSDAGGAKNILEHFKKKIKELFQGHALPELMLEVDNLFSETAYFTKTMDKKILGHTNDFKRCAEPYQNDPRPIDWNDVAQLCLVAVICCFRLKG